VGKPRTERWWFSLLQGNADLVCARAFGLTVGLCRTVAGSLGCMMVSRADKAHRSHGSSQIGTARF
jgi:hypothetical protein